ncbi:MAG TPA: pitrilysin family protein [Polyangia bacterium]
MPSKSCLAALSLMGVSCASTSVPASLGGSGKDRPARRSDGPPALVSETSLGPLLVRKWRLSNGLEVILLPDPAATSVAFMTWFRVGSRNENAAAGETGLAHLFEHLMFTQTTSARAPGEFDRVMEESGANTNAMTYYDFTAYIDEVPPEATSIAVRMEADRMVNLALADEQVTTERDVVSEERLGAVDDSVDGTIDELMYGKAFSKHPYRYPVIGRMEDIKAVTREKATRFYRTFYAPNNAVLVVTGRFEAEPMMKEIVERYGDIPASETLPKDTLVGERAPVTGFRHELTRPVPADRLAIGFPGPALGDADRAAFEILDEILTGGPSARLYRRLVAQAQIASSVDGSVAPTKDPGLYTLWVQLRRGHTAEDAERLIDEEINALAKTPVTDADLTKAKNRIETAFWRGLSSSEGKANQLGEFDVVTGDYRHLFKRADEIRDVTAADVQRAAETYLLAARAVVIARPKPETRRPARR